MKIWLILLGLVAVLALGFLGTRSADGPSSVPFGEAEGASFEVRVVKPRAGRPFFGVFPTALEEKVFDQSPLRFGQASPGAAVGAVGAELLELRADGWDLVVRADAAGRVQPGSRLDFPMKLAGELRPLRCLPADPPVGALRIAPRGDEGVFDGQLTLELATCRNTASGKTINWPPAPLRVRADFVGLTP